MLSPKTLTWPNRITSARLVLSPVLIFFGALQQPNPYLVLLALLLVSDFLDGFLARRLKQQTVLGTQLDTAADVTLCLCVLLGGALIWPQRMSREAALFIIVLVLLAVSGLTSLCKFRKLPSYHTYSAKASTAMLGVGIWLLFAGITPWVFRLAVAALTLSAVEGTGISLLTDHWQPNTPSLFHAWMRRKNRAR